ncbi:uncharacterized protein LOC130939341 [Arachis stenosperma]|uniref:uncharacterized protein LOC130939341 n=1 Tax=Arachis stenosperma TaxID=217475 RepID=UPI0025AC0212|nr:uncharacterized protein LOC130939341 [Arachis stenosperma]
MASDNEKDSSSKKKTEAHEHDDDDDDDEQEKMTPFLVAAKYGIVELVEEIQSRIPSAIYNTNSKKQNVLLVAVINRQPLVIEKLRKIIWPLKPNIWKNMVGATDDEENTMLHLAAAALEVNSWTIANSTLQMMWDTKWHEYIRGIMPEENYLRINHHRKTAKQIFIKSHRDLIKNSITELKETSVACSAVAGIIASVAFASTSSTSGGGGNGSDNKGLEVGKLESDDTLAVASLVGLCLSVSSIIMFLSLYNSRKLADDFRRSLPLKLLLGLIFLFLSVAAMIISFSSSQYSLLSHHGRSFLIPLYAATSFPVCLFVLVQIPRCFDILKTIISSQLP